MHQHAELATALPKLARSVQAIRSEPDFSVVPKFVLAGRVLAAPSRAISKFDGSHRESQLAPHVLARVLAGLIGMLQPGANCNVCSQVPGLEAA